MMVDEGCSDIEGSFMWAVWHMNNGLKVRRKCWERNLHILINDKIKIPHWNIPDMYVDYPVELNCIEAMDWELYNELTIAEIYKLKSEFVQKSIYQPNTININKNSIKIINLDNTDTVLGMKIIIDDSIDPSTAIISYEDRRNLSDRIENAINAAIFERQYNNKQTVCKDEDNGILKVDDVRNAVHELKSSMCGDISFDKVNSSINRIFGDVLVGLDETEDKACG